MRDWKSSTVPERGPETGPKYGKLERNLEDFPHFGKRIPEYFLAAQLVKYSVYDSLSFEIRNPLVGESYLGLIPMHFYGFLCIPQHISMMHVHYCA